jgi:hypothetical protein
MDNEAFEADVLASVNESLYTDQWTAEDSSGQAFSIGETWIGALYGLEENAYGQKAFHLFETEAAQRAWFDGVTEGR